MHHTQVSVDRYIADYQKVRTLAQKFPLAELPTLTGLSPSLIQQYLDLLQEYEPELALCSSALETDEVQEEQSPSSACGQCGQASSVAVHTVHRQPLGLSVGH